MSRQSPLFCLVTTAFVAILTGCQPQQPFYLKKVDNELDHYKGVATDIEYPDVEADRLADTENALAPFSLENRDTKNIWELSLEEAVQIALRNSKVMRKLNGQVLGPPQSITQNPQLAQTIYGPALAESDPRTGTEAALSAFDTQASASMVWQKLDTPQNVSPLYMFIFPNVARDDLGTFQAKVSKVTATGGQFSLAHNVAYDLSNKPSRAWSSDFNVNLTADVRQPLLQGAGVQFNRIAGPGATPGNYNGVMIARINTDIALTEFEASVRDLVYDVETAYWELYFQYRSLDAVIAGRDSALATWRKIYQLARIGAEGGEAAKLAQAQEQYFLFRSTAEQSLNNLYTVEAKLRYMLGLAATDGRLIRPKDEPTIAKVDFDWHEVLGEALARSVELRGQKWVVKRRELELIASKNFLLPRVDFVGEYSWLGIGNRIDGNSFWDQTSLLVQDANAYGTLAQGEFQGWQMGIQASIPLGFRRETAGVRNAQLSLARERARLQEAELELSHQLTYAIRDLQTNYVLSQTNFNRRIAAKWQVEAVAAAYENGTITLDVLLKAQQTLAQAESDYFRSLVNFNESIAEVHYRKGSLLEYDGVYLAEGPWPGKAYFDARRRARERAASTYLDYGFTQPRVISRGPIEQHPGMLLDQGEETTPAPTQPELVPTPEPESIPIEAIPDEPAPAAPKPMGEHEVSASGDLGGASQWKAVPGRSLAETPEVRQVDSTGWTAVERVRR